MRKSKFMKALLVFGMSAITATSIVGMAACTDNNSDDPGNGGDKPDTTCDHQFDGLYKGYMANTNQHWHYCVVCENELDRADHKDENEDGKCDTCGYEVAHSFDTSEWKSDASGHWYAATCEHTTEKGSFAVHKDEDATPNKCDVCGYEGKTSDGYKSFVTDHVTAEATKLIDNTFFVANDLPAFDSWGTKGLYASHLKATTPENYVDVSGGKAQLVTPAKEPATCLYVDWGNVAGYVVEGFFKISNVSGGNGYTAVQFTTSDGSKDSEIFGIRTNKGGALKYRLNGGSEVAVDGAQTWASGAGDEGSIEVYYKYDTATNKISVEIGGNAFVTDLQLTGSTLKGIKFSSGSGNADSYAIDDIIVVATPADLDTFKATLQANASAAATKVVNAGFDLSSDTTLNAAADKFATDLAAATTTEQCNAAYDTLYAALVTSYGDAVKNKINAEYVEANYTGEKNLDKAAYLEAKDTLTKDIAAANTVEKITAAYTKADGALKDLHDNAYFDKEDAVITVGNGIEGANTLSLKVGDQVTKDDLDKLVTIPAGQQVTGYYSDADCTAGNEVTVPFAASATITIYAKVEKLSGSESYDATALEAASQIANNEVMFDGKLFKAENGSGGSFTVYDCTAATEDSSKSFTKVLSAGGGSRTVTITAKANIKLTVYYTTTKSKYGDGQKANLQWAINSGALNTDPNAASAARSKSTAYKCEITLTAGDSCVLSISDSKAFTLFGLDASAV